MTAARPGRLIGREPSVGAVDEHLAAVTEDGAALVVVGDPGLGKTALLRAARDRAVEAGMRVVITQGGEFEAISGFGALRDLLEPLGSYPALLLPTDRAHLRAALGEVDQPAPGVPVGRGAIGSAALALLRTAARERPVLLVVDDAQWIDPGSAEVLAFMARRLTGTRVGLLAAARPGFPGPLEDAGLPEHRLPPLDDAASRALLQERSPGLAARERSRVVAEAGGVPLALLELARERTTGGAGPAPVPDDDPAVPLLRLFGPRVQALPEHTRELLLLAALEGTGDVGLLVAQVAGGDVLASLAPAEHSGLVLVDAETGRLGFRHPLVATTVVKLATPEDRRRVHARIAGALAGSPHRRAWHLAAAAPGPDEAVALALEEQSGLCLRRGDALGAADLLERAAEMSPVPAARARRQVHAAFIRGDVTGDLAGAAQLIAESDRGEPLEARSLPAALAATALLLNAECDVDTAHRILAQALLAHPGRQDPSDPVVEEALQSLALMSWFGGRRELWRPFEEVLEGLEGDPPPLVVLVHRTFGDPVHRGGRALPALDEALRHVDAERDPLRITRVGLACVYTDRLGECRRALNRVVDSGRSGGAVASAINALVSGCVDDWLTGRWDEARDLAVEGTRLSEQHGYRRYSVILSGYIDQLVRVARGDLDGGRAAAEEMAAWATERGARTTGLFAEHLHTLRAVALGDFEAAYRHASRISEPGLLAPYNPHALWVLFDLVEAATRTGRRAEAAAHVAVVREHHLDDLSPRLSMLVDGCAGLVATGDEAGALFERALAPAEGERWPFDRARVQLAYGEHLHRAADPAAGPVLAEATAAFRRLGARPWELRAAALLRASGATADRAVLEGAATGRPLTAREREVAALAAAGLSNREIGERLFLSHRSVGAVLYRVFPKLGVTSRAALAAALAAYERGTADEPTTPV